MGSGVGGKIFEAMGLCFSAVGLGLRIVRFIVRPEQTIRYRVSHARMEPGIQALVQIVQGFGARGLQVAFVGQQGGQGTG